MSRSRAYTFTINNWTQKDYDDLFALDCKYLVAGKEIAPTTGTPHLQCYIYFADAKSLPTVHRLIPRAHLMESRGDPEQNRNYCIEDGDFQEKGTMPMTAKRKGAANKDRFDLAYEAAKKGDLESIPNDLRVRYYSTFKKIKEENAPKPTDLNQLTNEWIWGPSGVGKSRYAHETYPDAYMKNKTKWWDHYKDEDVVIVDDVSPFTVQLTDNLKEWGDHYAFKADVKGDTIYIRPKKIIITSQYPIHEIYKDNETLTAMQRRYKEIYKPSNTPMLDNKLIL